MGHEPTCWVSVITNLKAMEENSISYMYRILWNVWLINWLEMHLKYWTLEVIHPEVGSYVQFVTLRINTWCFFASMHLLYEHNIYVYHSTNNLHKSRLVTAFSLEFCVCSFLTSFFGKEVWCSWNLKLLLLIFVCPENAVLVCFLFVLFLTNLLRFFILD